MRRLDYRSGPGGRSTGRSRGGRGRAGRDRQFGRQLYRKISEAFIGARMNKTLAIGFRPAGTWFPAVLLASCIAILPCSGLAASTKEIEAAARPGAEGVPE